MEHHSQRRAPVVVVVEKGLVDRIGNIELAVVLGILEKAVASFDLGNLALGSLERFVAPGKESVLGPFVVVSEMVVAPGKGSVLGPFVVGLDMFVVVGLGLGRHSSLAGCTFY